MMSTARPEAPSEADLSTLKSLTSYDEIVAELRQLNAEESRLDAELDSALRGQNDLERSLEMLDVLRCAGLGLRDQRTGLLTLQKTAVGPAS